MARELFDTPSRCSPTRSSCCAEAVDPILPRPLLDVLLSTDREAVETLRHTQFRPAGDLRRGDGSWPDCGSPGVSNRTSCWGNVVWSRPAWPGVQLGGRTARLIAPSAAGCSSSPRRRPDGGGVRRPRVRQPRRASAGVRRRVQRTQHGALRTGRGSGADRRRLQSGRHRCTRLETSRLPPELLDPVLDEFESFRRAIPSFAAPALPLVCNRTGAVLSAETPLNAQYWRKHSRQPVQFTERRHRRRARLLGADGDRPATDLTAAALQTWPKPPRPARSSAAQGGRQRTAADDRSPGRRLCPDTGRTSPRANTIRRRLELPTYPFQRRRYWPKTRRGRHRAALTASGCPESSAAPRIWPPATPSTAPYCRSRPSRGCPITSSTARWWCRRDLRHHGVCRRRAPARVKDVFYEPIILPEKAAREVQLTLHPPN